MKLYIPGQKTEYQLWKEQKRVESKAPVRKLQYETPYQGDSEGKKTYKWETNTLKPLSKKQYGNSYDDKFKSWAKEQGIQDHELAEFRTWMDAQEDGLKLKGSSIDSILKNTEKTTKAKAEKIKETIKNPPKLDYKAKSEDKREKKKKSDNMLTSAFTAAGEFFNPFDDTSADEAVKKYLNKKQSKDFQELTRGANRTVDSASLGIMSNLDKKVNNRTPYYNSEREFGKGGGTDMLTTGLGYLAPGVGSYKLLNATKVGKGLTAFGGQSLAKRVVSEGAKGLLTGGGLAAAEVGVREALNPKDQNWKDNAKWIGMGAGTGALADPLMYGAGKAIGKGFEKVSNSAMKNLLPSDQKTANAISSVIGKQDLIKPKEYTMPDGKKVHIKNRVTSALKDTQSKMEEIKPQAEAYDKEFQEAVQQQYDYLKNSMGKGVDTGTTSNGLDGNFKEVTGRYTISKNPKWYQDFYAQNGRKPNEKELRELAEQMVKEGFQDEVGDLPAWQPKAVQEIDDQIDELTSLIGEQPEQAEAIRPLIEALEEERQIALSSIDKTQTELGALQKQQTNLQRTLKGEAIQPMKVLKPKSTKIEDVVRDYGFDEVTPETVAQSYNQKTWYHGTGTKDLTVDSLDPFVGDHQSLFGHGIYLTDEPTIAEGYAKSRSKRTGTPTVYEASVKVDKVLDLEQPVTEEAKDALLKMTKSLDYQYRKETWEETPYFSDIVNEMANKGETTEQIIQRIRREVSDFSHENGISTNEFVENFQDLATYLKANGYDGITHTGGGRTGKDPHRVLIALDPNDAYSQTGRTGQITKFAPRQEAPAVQPMRINQKQIPEGVQPMKGDTIPLRQPTGDKQFKEMGFWESAVNKIKKAAGSENVYEQPIARREILENMRKNLGVTIKTGRLNADESVKGYFKVQPEVIRSRQHGDVQVISHEIGHALDKRFKLTNEAYDSELMKLGAKTSGKDYTSEQVRKEGLAEFIRLFLTDPEKAVQQAPAFSQYFDETLPKKVKNNLLKTQADVDRWIEQGPFFRDRGKIDFTGKEPETISDKIDKVYSQLVDKFDRLKKVEKEITGNLNSAEKSLYKKSRLSVGAPKKAEIILKDQFKPIFDGIEKEGISMKDISQYVKDVHALDLETMGEKVAIQANDELNLLAQDAKEMDTDGILKLIDDFQEQYGVELDESQVTAIGKGEELELNEDQLFLIAQQNRIETGGTLEEINAGIQKLESPKTKEIQQKIVAYNNYLLDLLVDAEVLSREAVDAMKEKYPNYVPFNRFFDEDMTQSLGNGGKGFADLQNPIKRMKGSFKDVIDPLESMIKNTFAVINAAEKNKVGLELSRLADIEGAGRFVERLDGAEPVRKEHIVTVFENGEKVQYQLDKDLYDAIQQLDEDRVNKVVQFLSYPTSMLRAGATLTPEFMLRNPIRDQFQSFVVSNYGYNPIIDLPKGIYHVVKGKMFNNSDVYKKWVMNGGGYGNYLSQDRNYLRETLNTLKKEGKWYQKGFKTVTNPKELGKLTLRTLQAMSELTEEATKVGEFKKAMKKGASEQEAAFQSRDLMDFGRVGSDIKQWNRAVAFLNANIQGKDKLARAFKNNPIRTTTRALTGVTFPAIGAYMAMEHLANEKQKETWRNTPKWMKDTFFILPIPGTDELARIPKPFDLAPVFANPVEQIFDYIKQNDPDSWGEFVKRQGKSLIDIPHMLTGLQPIIENVTNYSFFTGGPIVPRRDQDLLPQDQYGVTTSLTARTVGKLTADGGILGFLPGNGVSPYKADNLIRGYGAGLGKYATSGFDKALEWAGAGQLPPQEAKKWSELPVVNAFTVDSTGGGQVMTDFYDTIDKLTKERNSAKRNQEGYEEGDDVNYNRADDYKYMNQVSREISDLRNQYREIQSSYDLTPKMKRTQLDELDRQMNRLAREALVQVGEKTK